MQIQTLYDQGPTDLFTGPMASAINRRVKKMLIVTNATFTAPLTFMYTSGEGQAVTASGITFPALLVLNDIKSFRLLTGTALVVFYADPAH